MFAAVVVVIYRTETRTRSWRRTITRRIDLGPLPCLRIQQEAFVGHALVLSRTSKYTNGGIIHHGSGVQSSTARTRTFRAAYESRQWPNQRAVRNCRSET
jgi:hypothetical protein